MAGALSALQPQGQDPGIVIDPDTRGQPIDPSTLMAANGGYDPLLVAAMAGQGQGGALSANVAAPSSANTLGAVGQQLMGNPANIPGALSQYQKDYNAAAAQKQAQIQNAISILQASGAHAPGATNLPLLMAGGAMMSGGVGIGSEISKAALAGGNAIAQQREIERQNALAIGQLGVEGAEVPMQTAQQNLSNFLGIEKLGEEMTGAAGQEELRRSAINAGVQRSAITGYSREQVANITSGARVTAAQIAASKGALKYTGPDPSDPSQGLYINTTNGDVIHGPIDNTGKYDSKAYNDAAAIARTQGIPIDKAFQMVRGGFQSAADYDKAVTARANIIRQTPQGATLDPNQLIGQAREQVLAERGHGAAPATGTPAPATAAPSAAAPAIPQRPASVPAGSAYSPSRQMWKAPDGTMYDGTGKKVT